jgi:hypothetical protein
MALHTVGYQVWKRLVDISPAMRTHLKRQARHATPIFNHNEQSATDGRRAQLAVDADDTVDFALVRDGVLQTLRELAVLEHRLDGWVLLVSQAGCQVQHPHRDYRKVVVVVMFSKNQLLLSTA